MYQQSARHRSQLHVNARAAGRKPSGRGRGGGRRNQQQHRAPKLEQPSYAPQWQQNPSPSQAPTYTSSVDESQVTVDEYVRDQEEERRARRAVTQRVFHTQHEGRPVRINYVRYLNQYLLAVDGPKEVAVDVDRLIADHIRSKLLLDVAAIEEEQPVCIEDEPVEFLDFRLARVEKLGDRVAAQVPMESIVRDMMTLGFAGYWKGGARRGGKPRSHIRPCDRTAWVTRPDHEILMRYNRILQGLYDYYLSSNQPIKLKFILYLLQYSCAMTVAHKHKTSITKTFAKHGMHLEMRYMDDQRQMHTTSLNLLQSREDFERRPWKVPVEDEEEEEERGGELRDARQQRWQAGQRRRG